MIKFSAKLDVALTKRDLLDILIGLAKVVAGLTYLLLAMDTFLIGSGFVF